MSAAPEESVGFDFAAIEATESQDDSLIDQMAERAKITPRQANAILPIIRRLLRESQLTHASDLILIAETLRNVVLHIEAAGSKAQREAAFHRMAFDFRSTNSESMRCTAEAWGVSVQAVSKAVKIIQKRHALVLGSFNKSAEDAENYKLTNWTKKHGN